MNIPHDMLKINNVLQHFSLWGKKMPPCARIDLIALTLLLNKEIVHQWRKQLCTGYVVGGGGSHHQKPFFLDLLHPHKTEQASTAVMTLVGFLPEQTIKGNEQQKRGEGKKKEKNPSKNPFCLMLVSQPCKRFYRKNPEK